MAKESIHLSDGMVIKAEDIKDEGFVDNLERYDNYGMHYVILKNGMIKLILKDYGTLEDMAITIKPESLEEILEKTK